MVETTPPARGYTITLSSAAVLSTTAIFIRYLTQTYRLPALVLAFWRDGFVALTLLVILGLWLPDRLRIRRTHLGCLAASGLLTGLGYVAYSLLGRSASQRGLNPWTTLFYMWSS